MSLDRILALMPKKRISKEQAGRFAVIMPVRPPESKAIRPQETGEGTPEKETSQDVKDSDTAAVANAIGIPQETVTQDISKVSYASGQSGTESKAASPEGTVTQ